MDEHTELRAHTHIHQVTLGVKLPLLLRRRLLLFDTADADADVHYS